MTKRSYDQYCPLARALDLVGERWTLLIARELLAGPRRYTDLAAGLPGIPTNLLADRLRELGRLGLIRQVKLPPPAASTVYELTDLGHGLEGAIRGLAHFGFAFMGRRRDGDAFRGEWLALALRALARPGAPTGVRETYELRLSGELLNVRVDDGSLEVGVGAAEEPDLVLEMDVSDFIAIGSGQVTPEEVAARGGVHLEGDPAALGHFRAIFAGSERADRPREAEAAPRPR